MTERENGSMRRRATRQPAPVKPLVLGESSLPGTMRRESEAQP